jgi:polysaccharide pyruvyl transferase WcaK-like protein
MTKILINNAYTWYNKGNAAILIGMFQAIRKYFPNAKITIILHIGDRSEKIQVI